MDARLKKLYLRGSAKDCQQVGLLAEHKAILVSSRSVPPPALTPSLERGGHKKSHSSNHDSLACKTINFS